MLAFSHTPLRLKPRLAPASFCAPLSDGGMSTSASMVGTVRASRSLYTPSGQGFSPIGELSIGQGGWAAPPLARFVRRSYGLPSAFRPPTRPLWRAHAPPLEEGKDFESEHHTINSKALGAIMAPPSRPRLAKRRPAANVRR